MKTKIKFGVFMLFLLISGSSYAGFGIGGDMVSRYVWRGTDFGKSASVQPSLSYTTGGLEIGAWGSYALTSEGADENDFYLTYTLGYFGLTLTDYYYPEAMELFNYKDKDSIHFLEALGSTRIGKLKLLAGYFFSGDPDNSVYLEAGYGFDCSDEVSASLTAGAGNGMYVVKEDFNLVFIGLTVSKGPMSASFIINTDSETSHLVFGYSF